MNQLIYNSFPRSANVYAGYAGSAIIWGDYTTVHIPQIFGTKGLDMISIFRKPEDCIASLIHKQLETQDIKSIRKQDIVDQCFGFRELYRDYMNFAKNNSESTYILKFDDFINDPIKCFLDIAKRFNRIVLDDYELKFNSLSFDGRLWKDKYDGHVPREKDETRLFIENIVSSLDFIQDLNKEYEDFIEQYRTYKRED